MQEDEKQTALEIKLPDFVKVDNITKELTQSIQEDLEYRAKQNYSSVIAPENITECLRRMYYRISCSEIQSPKMHIEFLHKCCIVSKWISYFSKCKKVILVDKDVLVVHSEYNLAGKVSAYIETNDCKYVVNVLPVSQEDFNNVNKSPRRRDVISTMVYLWLSELKADGLLIYENNNTQEYIIYHVFQYAPIIRAVKQKCKQLVNYKMRGTAPSRISGKNAEKECKICEYQSICLN